MGYNFNKTVTMRWVMGPLMN